MQILPPNQQPQFRLLKLQVQRRLQTCLELAEIFFKRKFDFPEVNFDVKGLKAGVAYLQKNTIKFNRTLLLENSVAFIQQVVPHELAHLIVYQQFGKVKPHGKEWQLVMEQIFHLSAQIYHEFDTASVQGKTVNYQCHCQIHALTLRRHNKIVREKAVYLCRNCKKALTIMS